MIGAPPVFIEVEKVLIDRTRIAERVREMADAIAHDLEQELAVDLNSPEAEGRVVFVPIMTGAMIFTADLVRELPFKLSLGLVAVSSYPGESITSKGAHFSTRWRQVSGSMSIRNGYNDHFRKYSIPISCT